jgi:hypothetical protein
MRYLIGYGARGLAVLLLLAPAARVPSPAEAGPRGARPLATQDAPPPKCCFTNPGYSGTCEVQPAKDESCGQILDYLNNPMSQGKDYCGSTSVRGGWKSASCEAK